MTPQEIEILESAMIWIQADAENSDISSTRREGNKLAEAIFVIILKYQSK
jgi:hypothetical protein